MLAYATLVPVNHHWRVNFPEHLAILRKEKGLTQPQLAEKIGVHVAQVRRYEAGTSQPTLDVIRAIAVALGISADELLFAKDERGPDASLKLQTGPFLVSRLHGLIRSHVLSSCTASVVVRLRILIAVAVLVAFFLSCPWPWWM